MGPAFLQGTRSNPSNSSPYLQASSASGVPSSSNDETSSVLSAGSTTESELAFDSKCFEQMASLGRTEHWWIDPSELFFMMPMRVLGRGGFGVVVAASLHGKAVAVKTPRTYPDEDFSSHMDEFFNELRILRHVRHPNLVLFHGALINAPTKEFALVYEFVRGMQLTHYILKSPEPPGSLDRVALAIDICSALRYMHANKPSIVHGDLKAANVMVELYASKPRAKVIDFGLARLFTAHAKRLGGTKSWAAPEAFQSGCKPTPAADVFSFGWVALFVMSGLLPQGGKNDADLNKAIAGMMKHERVDIPTGPEEWPFKAQCLELATSCLQFRPGDRPSIEAVYASLVSWLSAESACAMGFDVVHTKLKTVPWRDASTMLQGANGIRAAMTALKKITFVGGDFPTTMQIEVKVESDLRIMLMKPSSALQQLGLPGAGTNFSDWMQREDYQNLRLFILSLLTDLQHGFASAPIMAKLGEVRLSPRSARVPSGLSATVNVLIPNLSGQVSMRLVDVHWNDVNLEHEETKYKTKRHARHAERTRAKNPDKVAL